MSGTANLEAGVCDGCRKLRDCLFFFTHTKDSRRTKSLCVDCWVDLADDANFAFEVAGHMPKVRADEPFVKGGSQASDVFKR